MTKPISEDDKWQESWDKMEETERRERDIGEIGEEDAEEFERQDREDKGITHLEERRRREPPIGEPCERCDGAGHIDCTHDQGCCASPTCPGWECPTCDGTGRVPFGLLSKCGRCDGEGKVVCCDFGSLSASGASECPRCLGTRVEP